MNRKVDLFYEPRTEVQNNKLFVHSDNYIKPILETEIPPIIPMLYPFNTQHE